MSESFEVSADNASADERGWKRLQIGEWSADPEADELTRGTETVRIEPKAMDVLMLLADRVGRVVSREDLLVAVWPGVVISARYRSVQRESGMLRINIHLVETKTHEQLWSGWRTTSPNPPCRRRAV